jgi:hypothetical protein
MTPRLTPGAKLRRAMHEALAEASEDAGGELEFTPAEVRALDIAVDAADRAGELAGVYRRELKGEARPTTLAKLSAELRGLERLQLDAIGKIQLDPEHLSNVRRQAARGRWGINGVVRG